MRRPAWRQANARRVQAILCCVAVMLCSGASVGASDGHLYAEYKVDVGTFWSDLVSAWLGRANQGIAADGDAFWTSSSYLAEGSIHKWGSGWPSSPEKSKPGITVGSWDVATHVGDIAVDGPRIYVPLTNELPGGLTKPTKMQIRAYNRETLAFDTSCDVSDLLTEYGIGGFAGVARSANKTYAVEFSKGNTSKLFAFLDLSPTPAAVYTLASNEANGVSIYSNPYGKYAYISAGMKPGDGEGRVDVYNLNDLPGPTNDPLARYTYDTPNMHAEGLTFSGNELWVAQGDEVHRLETPILPPYDNDDVRDLDEAASDKGYDPNTATTLNLDHSGVEDLDGASRFANATRLDLEFNQITSIESGDFDGLSSLQVLQLNDNQITGLDSGDFSGLSGLEDLRLGDNAITVLKKDTFDGTPNLARLWVNGNNVAAIESGAFAGLSQLGSLDLNGNQITSVGSGAFSGLTALKTLLLSRNQITSIESGAFSGLGNLQELDLGDNQITSIQPDDFEGLNGLIRLGLYRNTVRSVEVGTFNNLSNLEDLDLGNNQLDTIDTGLFGSLGNLKRLILYRNGATSIETGAFEGLSALEKLYLDHNEITHLNLAGADLPALEVLSIDTSEVMELTLDGASVSSSSLDAIVGEVSSATDARLRDMEISGAPVTRVPSQVRTLTQLQSLDLEFNQITSIESGDFDGLSSLQVLQLNDNQITGLDSGDFSGLSGLEDLRLGDNAITVLKKDTFDGTPNLARLWVNSNNVAAIESGAFAGLSQLGSLDLNGNQITSVGSGAFSGLTALKTLLLSRNQITSMESGAFSGLGSLQWLDLDYNQISLLNLADADLSSLETFYIDTDDEVTALVLDGATLSQTSLATILGELDYITEASLLYTDLGDTTSLDALLTLDDLGLLTVDDGLYGAWQTDFDPWAAGASHDLVIVPEPATLALLAFGGLGLRVRRRRRR